MTWYEARDYCKTLRFEYLHDAHLVEIYNSTQDTFLKDAILKIGNTKSWWTGLTDIETETLWKWDNSGNIATYFNWGANQPDGIEDPADCMILFDPDNHKWHDTPCTKISFQNHYRHAICQFPF